MGRPNHHDAKAQRDLLRPKYVNSGRGWKIFFFTCLLAAIAGLSVRLYFSPARLHAWIEAALERQPTKMAVEFDDAVLRLADGSVPQLAVELIGVRFIAAPQCQTEPALTIARLRVPLRLSQLFAGRLAVGVLGADDLIVDLDRLKGQCEKGESSVAAVAAEPSRNAEPARDEKDANSARPWWTPDQLETVRKFIRGFEFRRISLKFENGNKQVYLDSFEAELDSKEPLVHANASLRVPPELTHGEQLPDLVLAAEVRENRAEIQLKARLSEGSLQGNAILSPAPQRQLEIDTRMKLVSVPLSTLVPLLTRVAVIKREMKPKFLWLNCDASIRGKFQGLVRTSPLKLENCLVQGNGTHIEVAQATRLPEGRWEPFQAKLESADMKQILGTFSIDGLDGIATEYGRLDGTLDVSGENTAQFAGRLKGLQLRFSNRSVRALQTIDSLTAKAELHDDGRIAGEIPAVEIQGGEFKGVVKFDIAKRAEEGQVALQIERLRLAENVERVMLGGNLENLSGEVKGQLKNGGLAALNGNLRMKGFKSPLWNFEDLSLQPSLSGKGGVQLKISTKEMLLTDDSVLLTAARPLFFGREVAKKDGQTVLQDVEVLGRIPVEGGFQWEKAQGALDSGQIRFVSEGGFARDHILSGVVSVDYPQVKKLKWSISGSTGAPGFALNEESAPVPFRNLLKNAAVTEKALGFH